MSRQNPYYAKGQTFSGIGLVTRIYDERDSTTYLQWTPHCCMEPMADVTDH
jgi:hypothetical protein